MLAQLIQVGALVLLLVLLVQDLRHRLLSNKLVLAYSLLFVLYAISKSAGWPELTGHLMAGALAFLAFFLLFLLRAMGGGDVKLGAAVFLWSGPAQAWPVLVIIALTGGLVAVTGLLADHACPQSLVNRSNTLQKIRYALSARRGVPYGVALVAGGIFILFPLISQWL